MTKPTIAILGAGKLGITLSQLGLKAGYPVYIAGSGSPEKINLSVQVLAPGAVAATAHDAIAAADVVILALPLGKYQSIPQQLIGDKLVVDAMNYWWEIDGDRSDLRSPATSTSQLVRDYLGAPRLVKAFSHIGYHHLHDEARPKNTLGRKAMAIAGDNPADNQIVAGIVDDFGFDPLIIGELAAGRALEPDQPMFGVNLEISALRDLLQS